MPPDQCQWRLTRRPQCQDLRQGVTRDRVASVTASDRSPSRRTAAQWLVEHHEAAVRPERAGAESLGAPDFGSDAVCTEVEMCTSLRRAVVRPEPLHEQLELLLSQCTGRWNSVRLQVHRSAGGRPREHPHGERHMGADLVPTINVNVCRSALSSSNSLGSRSRTSRRIKPLRSALLSTPARSGTRRGRGHELSQP
jgi:hypothetical protein